MRFKMGGHAGLPLHGRQPLILGADFDVEELDLAVEVGALDFVNMIECTMPAR